MLSALLRLDLYIAAYGLTYWRLAALIWFLLVALGLVLIVAQIVLAKTAVLVARDERWRARGDALRLLLHQFPFRRRDI